MSCVGKALLTYLKVIFSFYRKMPLFWFAIGNALFGQIASKMSKLSVGKTWYLD